MRVGHSLSNLAWRLQVKNVYQSNKASSFDKKHYKSYNIQEYGPTKSSDVSNLLQIFFRRVTSKLCAYLVCALPEASIAISIPGS